MVKKYWLTTFLFCLVTTLTWPLLAIADNPLLDPLDNVASTFGPYKKGDTADTGLSDIIGTAVGIFISLIGVIFLVLMIYAGYMWMTAHGDEEKVTKAKSIIIQVLIGIVVVVGAYASWKYLFSRLF